MTLIKAMSLLSKAFSSEGSKTFGADLKYILRVMERCKTKEEKMVVILHQLLLYGKSQGWTLARIKEEGFTITIINALKVIDKAPEDSCLSFVTKLKGNLLARRVLISEIADRLDLSLLLKISKKDLEDLKTLRNFYMHLLNYD